MSYSIDYEYGHFAVLSLSNTKYDNYIGTAATDDAFISVDSSVIGSNQMTFPNCQFDNPGFEAEFNVHRIGSDYDGWWYFQSSTGDYDLEPLDGGNGVDEADPGMVRWDDSSSEEEGGDDEEGSDGEGSDGSITDAISSSIENVIGDLLPITGNIAWWFVIIVLINATVVSLLFLIFRK